MAEDGRRMPGLAWGKGVDLGEKNIMSQSHAYLIIHAIFWTNGMQPVLKGELKSRLVLEIQETLEVMGCRDILVKSAIDHIHVRFRQNHLRALPEIMQYIKSTSSSNVNRDGIMEQAFAWGLKYKAWSLGPGSMEVTEKIMEHQEEIHKLMGMEKEVDILRRWYEGGEDPEHILKWLGGGMSKRGRQYKSLNINS